MKRYSPSATETWMTCPLKRHLHAQGWQRRRLGKREMGGILGTAFAAGVTTWKSSQLVGIPTDPYICANVAWGSAKSQMAEMEQIGATVGEYDRAQYEAIARRASDGVRRIMTQDPLPPDWTILDVERILPEWGNCRIDLGAETPLGVVVVDWKCKLSLDQKWLPKEMDRYRLSEQRFHYSAAYEDFLHRSVYAFYIVLVVLEPFKVHVLPFVNDPETLAMWMQARRRTWADMEAEENGERQVGIAAKHWDEFGPCEFQGACFESHLDPHLMQHAYTVRKSG